MRIITSIYFCVLTSIFVVLPARASDPNAVLAACPQELAKTMMMDKIDLDFANGRRNQLDQLCGFNKKDKRISPDDSFGGGACESFVTEHWGKKRKETRESLVAHCQLLETNWKTFPKMMQDKGCAIPEELVQKKYAEFQGKGAEGTNSASYQRANGMNACDDECQANATTSFLATMRNEAKLSEDCTQKSLQVFKDMFTATANSQKKMLALFDEMKKHAANHREQLAQMAKFAMPDDVKQFNGASGGGSLVFAPPSPDYAKAAPAPPPQVRAPTISGPSSGPRTLESRIPKPKAELSGSPGSMSAATGGGGVGDPLPAGYVLTPNGHGASEAWARKSTISIRDAANMILKYKELDDRSLAELEKLRENQVQKLREYDVRAAEHLNTSILFAAVEKTYSDVALKFKASADANDKRAGEIQTNNLDNSGTINPGGSWLSGTAIQTAGVAAPLVAAAMQNSAVSPAAAIAPQTFGAITNDFGSAASRMPSADIGTVPQAPATGPNSAPSGPYTNAPMGAPASPEYKGRSVASRLADIKMNSTNTSTGAIEVSGGNKGKSESKGPEPKKKSDAEILAAGGQSTQQPDLLASAPDLGSGADFGGDQPAAESTDPFKEILGAVKESLGFPESKPEAPTGGGFFGGGSDSQTRAANGQTGVDDEDVDASGDASPEMMDRSLFKRVSSYFNDKCLKKGCVATGVKQRI